MLRWSVGRWFTLLLLTLLSAVPALAQDSVETQGWEDVPILLRHRPEVSATVFARYQADRFFLPLTDLLSRLKIDHQLDVVRRRLKGTFGRGSRPFEFDFLSATFSFDGRHGTLGADDFVWAELEAYVSPGLLQDVLGMVVRLDRARLAVEITTREEMPVTMEARQRRRAMTRTGPAEPWEARTHFPRERRRFDAGALGYFLSMSDGSARAEIRGGAELVGGALELTADGERTEGQGTVRLRRMRWQYARSSNLLSQVIIGDVQAIDLQGRPLKGFELTNRPVEVRTILATQLLEGELLPDWELELLVNGHVLERATPDALGRFRLEAPLGYGTSTIRLRKIGPAGEVIEEEQVVEVPFTFVPRGVVQYSLAAGRTADDVAALLTNVAVGVTDRVTVNTFMDLAPEHGDPLSTLRAAASARLMQGYVGSLELAPSGYLRATVDASFPSFARFSADFRQQPEPAGGHSGEVREYSARAFLLAVPRLPQVTARLGFVHRRYSAGPLEYSVDTEVAAGLRLIRPALGYRLSEISAGGTGRRRQELRVATLLTPRAPLKALRSVALRAAFGYDVELRQSSGLELSASGAVAPGTVLEAAYRRARAPQRSESQLRLRLDRSWARASTAVARSGNTSRATQTIGGTVGWDSHERRLVRGGRSGQPRAGAAIHFFLDENGNGAFDSTEHRVTGVALQMNRGAQIAGAETGRARISDLTAYHHYKVRLSSRRIANPLWAPAFEAFSFVADPNRYKHIAVPFHAGGTIDGSVQVRRNGGERPIPGLRMHLVDDSGDVISVPVFGDGTFYQTGLRPGRYRLSVDSGQLAVLGLTTDPHSRTLEIRHTRDGDIVSDLRFTLAETDPAPPGVP